MSVVNSVRIRMTALVIEKSSPSIVCCVVSDMTSTMTRSNGVICASVRLPERRMITSSVKYIACPRMTASMVSLRER